MAGENWPWGDPHSLPAPPASGRRQRRDLPARRRGHSGITAKVGPVAIANGRFGNRPHCIYRGFCLQGCKVNAKASPLITHIPDALAHGAEIRADAMVTRVEIDERTGRATGVHYVRDGVAPVPDGRDGRRRRLLDRDPAAAAQLGLRPVPRRTVQRLRPGRPLPHGAGRPADRGPVRRRGTDVQGAAARGEHRGSSTRPTRRSPTSGGSPSRPSRRCRSPGPSTSPRRGTGGGLREYMSDYVHWSCLGALCEFLPQPENRVTLAEEKDRHGLPVARFSYSQCDNDRPLMEAAQRHGGHPARRPGATRSSPSTATPTLSAAPAWPPTSDTASSTANCRTFAVPNLYITDGSVLPTQGSANPALTIMAVAARAADRLTRAPAPGARAPLDRPPPEEVEDRRHDQRRDRRRDSVTVSAYTIPTDAPEADGTLAWTSTDHGRRRQPGAGGLDGPRVDLRPRRLRGHGHRQAAARRGHRARRPAPSAAPSTAHGEGRPERGPSRGRRLRPSPPSTSPCGTSRPACSTCRCTGCSAPSATRVPVYGSGGFTTYDEGSSADQLSALGARAGHSPSEDQDRRVLGH